jgi:hypothetical protein
MQKVSHYQHRRRSTVTGRLPVTVNPRHNSQTTFYRLQEQELRWLKANKLINNASYIYLALKIENPFCDQPIKIRVKEFAMHWGVPESSIYECIAKLKELESINIQTKEIVISWRFFSQQEELSDNPESFQDSRKQSGIPENSPGFQNEFQDSRMDSEIPERDIYIDRVCDQTITDLQTDSSQTETDCAAAEVEIVDAELDEEEPSSTSLATVPNQNSGHHKNEAPGGDKFSAAADADLLREINAIAHDWTKRPWMISASQFHPAMSAAVWESNPGIYSLEGRKIPNRSYITDRLKKLERMLRGNSTQAIDAYQKLQAYWATAQDLINPNADAEFSKLSEAGSEAQRQIEIQKTLEAISDLL